MSKKTYPIYQVKAAEEGTGIVEAIVSVFNNIDLVGDRVMPGAFDKTIRDWKAKNERGRYLPFVDEHDWSREGRIGKVLYMAETPEGLLVKAKLFMEQQSARDIFNQIKEGVLGEFSFAYDVIRERKAKDGANELMELGLLDASTALHGANPETRLVGVKDDPNREESESEVITETKAGRMISAKNESKIREAIASLEDVLSTLTDIEGKADEPPSEAKTDDPEIARLREELTALTTGGKDNE